MNKKDIISAHKFSSCHKAQLKVEQTCGCFYCLKIFNSSEITVWICDDKDDTAICPYCGIDSVIGKSSGYEITSELLEKMRKHWFW